ncbi:rCG43979 [Rattus norvegicus]|uniref:RCG43979 n=1 Tax=Rattus norvegicus TaxID=10116 RepID=A6J7P5_RAT|nr:rCG43979 [Rattus norvegicus]
MVPADSRLRWPIVQLESQNLLSAPCGRTYCNPWPGSLTAGWGLGRQGEVAEDWGGMLEACGGLGKGI